MNCQEAKDLWSAYQDGELDRAFCGEIEQHLEACPECRRFFAAQQEFDGALSQALQHGEASAAMWQREAAAIRAAFYRQDSPIGGEGRGQGARSLVDDRTAASTWIAWLWPSPKFCGALAAVWVALLMVNRLADFDSPVTANRAALAPEQRAALVEQQRQFKALLMATDYEKAKPTGLWLGPRTERTAPAGLPVGSNCELEENADQMFA